MEYSVENMHTDVRVQMIKDKQMSELTCKNKHESIENSLKRCKRKG